MGPRSKALRECATGVEIGISAIAGPTSRASRKYTAGTYRGVVFE